MFKDIRIPKNIDSPILEAIFEIRYAPSCPGEALYGLLIDDVFSKFPNNENHTLPILEIPPQIRNIDPNLKFQPYYRASKDGFAFAIGPHSIVFSALRPYLGWTEWTDFFSPILETIKKKNIIHSVERIGLRTLDLFNGNILDKINANLTIADKAISTSPTSFFTEFEQDDVRVLLNIGNAANVNGQPTKDSLMDIDCIRWFNCEANVFFSTYKEVLEKAHSANKQVFFGLMNQELLTSLNPEY